MADTDPEAARVLVEVLRKLFGADRLRMAFEMSGTARELAITRLRREQPDWSGDEHKRELLRYAFLPAPLPEIPL